MVSFPLALLLGLGLFLSLRGKGTVWCAFLAVALGLTLGGTQVGEAFMGIVNTTLAALGGVGAGITG